MTNHYRVLASPAEFFADLEDSIASARKSIKMQFLTFEADTAGKRISDAMMSRVDSKLDMRLLVDKFNDYFINDNFVYRPKSLLNHKKCYSEHLETQNLFRDMESKGIKVIRTKHNNRSILKIIMNPNHKKIVVIDEKIAYLGGVNISDHNYLWNDFMVRIEGDIVKAISQDFELTWQGKDDSYSKTVCGDILISDCITHKTSMIYNKVIELVRNAKRSIFIESPYFGGMDFLKEIKKRDDISITLIIPNKNNRLYYRPLRKYYANYFADRKNIDLRFYNRSEGMTHSKLLVVDNKTVSFGSSNFCEMSRLMHDEINIFSENKMLVDEIISKIVIPDTHNSVRCKEKVYLHDRLSGLMVVQLNSFLGSTFTKRAN